MTLNSNEILDILPHRYPFVFIDKIIECEPGKKAVGLKAVSQNESFFQGHFPKQHVMPGVLIVESMAQVGAIAILTLEEHKGKIVYFTKIKNMKFSRQVVPGDLIQIEVELLKVKFGIGIGSVKAIVNDKVVAAGELQFAIEK